MNPRCPECGLYELNDGSEDTLWTCECELDDETPATPTALAGSASAKCEHGWGSTALSPCPYCPPKPTAPEAKHILDAWVPEIKRNLCNDTFSELSARVKECAAAWDKCEERRVENEKITAELAEAKRDLADALSGQCDVVEIKRQRWEIEKLTAENSELRDFRRRVQAQAFEGQCLELEEKLSDIDDELQTANFDKATAECDRDAALAERDELLARLERAEADMSFRKELGGVCDTEAAQKFMDTLIERDRYKAALEYAKGVLGTDGVCLNEIERLLREGE